MKTYDVYTAVAVQPETIMAEDKKGVRQNLQRCLEILSGVKSVSTSAKVAVQEVAYEQWAPIKLVSFPEFFLQGESLVQDIDKRVRDVAIEIPGEEIEELAKVAVKNEIYLSGVALEIMPEFPDLYFNCHFIISPEGKVIHKYHKYTPAIHFELTTSPHDVFDRYYEIFGQGKTLLQTFFPVTDTAIGKIGTIICMDGHFPENWRALALNGAEVIIHPTFAEPMISPPRQWWELQNRTNAQANMVYVVAPINGWMHSNEYVKGLISGQSMIVDSEGVIIASCPYPGESMTSAVIRLDHLRRRRMDPSRNLISLLRTEVYREMYDKAIYPKNLYANREGQARSFAEIQKRDTQYLKVINQLIEDGVYTRPESR